MLGQRMYLLQLKDAAGALVEQDGPEVAGNLSHLVAHVRKSWGPSDQYVAHLPVL